MRRILLWAQDGTDTVRRLLCALPFSLSQAFVAFLLFVEPPSAGPLQIPADAPEYKNERVERRKWDVWKFAQQYGLKLVGANFLTLRVD